MEICLIFICIFSAIESLGSVVLFYLVISLRISLIHVVVKLIASSGGQYLRVGKAITSVDAILGGAAQPLTQSALAPMPTAAAVAAAAATAKIQAMETTEPPKVVVPKLGFSAVEFFPPPGNFKGYFVRSRIMPYCFIVS